MDNICEIHILSDSVNALWHTMDASYHSGHLLSVDICNTLVPWFQLLPNSVIHLHHISDKVEINDHQLAHLLATSTRVEAGGEPIISADFT